MLKPKNHKFIWGYINIKEFRQRNDGIGVTFDLEDWDGLASCIVLPNTTNKSKNISKMEMLSKYTGILINKTKNPFQTN